MDKFILCKNLGSITEVSVYEFQFSVQPFSFTELSRLPPHTDFNANALNSL